MAASDRSNQMSLSDDRRTAGIYGDPVLKALALDAAASGQPISSLDVFGVPRPAQQQPSVPPVLLRLIAQMMRDKVETDPLPDPRGNIPGTDTPDRSEPESWSSPFVTPNYDVDLGIERKPDPNLDRNMTLPSILQAPVPTSKGSVIWPLFLMRR
jgi:hypothetical protein